MKRGDAPALGKLMDESHVSMRDDFEISSDALNAIVDAARREDGCYGARMTGGGFAGCAVALVDSVGVQSFADRVAEGYQRAVGRSPAVYLCAAAAGASTSALTAMAAGTDHAAAARPIAGPTVT